MSGFFSAEHWTSALLRHAARASDFLRGAKPPDGLLGSKWGDDASAVATKLGLHCRTWTAWTASSEFEQCTDGDHAVAAFGFDAYASLFRKSDKLEGMSLQFKQCSAKRDQLTASIRKQFGIADTDSSIYQVYANGEAIRFTTNSSDDTCVLFAAGPSMGTEFVNKLWAHGVGEAGEAFRGRR